jgi:soluble lytic murein transglycosylase-like protein
MAMIGALTALGQTGLERQRAAIERQRRANEPAREAVQRQTSSVSRQLAAARAAPPGAAWELAVPAGGGVFEPGDWAEPACPRLDAQAASAKFQAEERQNGLPAGLLEAVAAQESALVPCAVSRSGAMGLMQLMPSTAMDLGVENPFDPWQSLRGGGIFLRQLLDRYGGDLNLALGAYNAGPAVVDAFGGVPPYSETQSYIANILSRLPKPASAAESPPKP